VRIHSQGRRQRVQDLRSDLPTILGGIALSVVVLVLFGAILGMALAIGVLQDWHPLGWVALAGLGAVILSLLAMFLGDYWRWRRTMTGALRG
jgi:sterol desaturase/sphingolipid hydroxylase (fatty acid hydroxylase superfamily)